jgi:hypothetical protein
VDVNGTVIGLRLARNTRRLRIRVWLAGPEKNIPAKMTKKTAVERLQLPYNAGACGFRRFYNITNIWK